MDKNESFPKLQTENQENSIESVFETRKKIIEALKNKLKTNTKVVAAFLAGSEAQDSVDEYSDIDFDIIISDFDSVDEIEAIVKETLETFSPIKTELKVSFNNNVTIIHQFEKISKFLHVDVLYMTNADEVNKDQVIVLFDKEDVIKVRNQSKNKTDENIKNRIENIEKYSELRQTYLERALNRGLLLEAVEKYNILILKNLIEALRLQYCPEKSDYHVKHIDKDLPEDVLKEVEDLFKISSLDEIREKSKRANELLMQTLEKLK